jgi:hypothetical protein
MMGKVCFTHEVEKECMWRMPPSGMLRRVALVRTDVSEERMASIIRATRIGDLITAGVPSSPVLVTLMMEAIRFSETLIITRDTRRNIQEDGILHSHRRETLNLVNTCEVLHFFNGASNYQGNSGNNKAFVS